MRNRGRERGGGGAGSVEGDDEGMCVWKAKRLQDGVCGRGGAVQKVRGTRRALKGGWDGRDKAGRSREK